MGLVERISHFCVRQRTLVAGVIIGGAVIFGAIAARGVDIRTIFHDMLPTEHPYVKINDEYNADFGGPNVVTIMVESTQGDIFQMPVLETIRKITDGMYLVPAVNNFQIVSIGARKTRSIEASTAGINSIPIMWPGLPESQAEIDLLRERVLANPLIYGLLVSRDLKAAIIQADFIDHLMDYPKVFAKLEQTLKENEGPHVKLYMVGNPVLVGWVINYLPETLQIVLITMLLIIATLFITVRSIRGVVIPMIAGLASGAYALGFASLLNINFDPLVIVILFLITARCISHSVQMLMAWDDRIGYGESPMVAGQRTLFHLFRPGMLGIATDAGGVAIVATMPMPLMQKTALTGSVWITSITLTGIILTPVLLTWVKDPHARVIKFDFDKYMAIPLRWCTRIVLGKVSSWGVLVVSALILAVSSYFAVQITVGDARPGTPLFWPDQKFNVDAAAINSRFPGSDNMYVVIKTEHEDGLKLPEVLSNMDRLQRFLEAQPEVGATLSLVDLMEPINSAMNEGNRRFQELGKDNVYNAALLFMYMQGTTPEDYGRFTGPHFDVGSIQLSLRDHKGDTLRTATSRIKQYIEANPLPGKSQYFLAGGYAGVLAAVNEEIFRSQVESIALSLLMIFAFSWFAYRSTVAGLFFMPLVIMSNMVTFAFMTLNNIGMSINTLPVAALGIGLGVDYALYMVDGMKERYESHGDRRKAVSESMLTAGRGVLITGATMVVAVFAWYASSLRFQAEMGLLISLWLLVSAMASLLLTPAMVVVFKPKFVFGERAAHADGVPTPAHA